MRVAAMLLLLYAQPVTRICSLRLDDVVTSPADVSIRFTSEAVAVPEPFGTLVRDYLPHRRNTNTASNPQSPWLFPGYTPGRHIHPQYLMQQIRKLGINLQGALNRAIRELVSIKLVIRMACEYGRF
ncbi:hypothetical protein ONR57_18080 [Hoyosella sp. YIM 151337]|uniref:hypothetical protein n=1 Tax=Hoyosella sp. YIM 151337 TaxID=2992742 RepID=UPI0022357A72|nr:hypothetical protein [Hoyosella sp. YIM 151337]MCW4355216.1 hypothetical protein [Hoyosella sp. YIM 151337]